ncbi:hypothetical protein MBLNU459_g8002t1 [Dothideomycetes sp. NU459]
MIPRDRRTGTPSKDSPFGSRSSVPRSPIKTSSSRSPELGLTLRQVIGTTCQNVNCFDCLPSQGAFAFTAGAAAVVATVDQDRKITQRFFRATPIQGTGGRPLFASTLGRQDSYGQESRFKSPATAGQTSGAYGSGSPWNNSASFDWNSDSPGAKGGNIKERVKAATAVSFSPNARFLAVGETGYKPRILIFSLAEKASVDCPVAVIPEHTFGVHAVAFSPDSKYLASLGTVNDGFLYIWSIDERTGAASLMASNKCTSVVRQIAWFGSNLVTVGVRFIKVWRPNEVSTSCNENGDQRSALANRSHKPLAGRNSILGDLLEATFTCIVAISEDKAIVCTEGGDVCILDDSEKNQRLIRVASVDFSIAAACLGPLSQVIVTGLSGNIKTLSIAELGNAPPMAATSSGPSTPTKASSRTTYHFTAIGSVGDNVVTVDNRHGIQLRSVPSSAQADELEPALQSLPAHADAVLGVRALSEPNELAAAFLTWSSSGTVIFWSSDCDAQATLRIPLDQSIDMYNIINELRAVVSSASATHAISGDRYGLLRIFDTTTSTGVSSLRAHSGEITDIAINEDTAHALVASSSRDRTIQLFTWASGQLDLLQTLDEHAGSVTSLLFGKSGSQLLSCSSDRTVVVREAIHRDDGSPPVFVIVRTVTLKNSPTSMRMSLYDDTILLSATDRSIQLISIRTGRTTSSFKASDPDGGDAVVMSSLVHLPSTSGSPIIAGVSSSDKSVRLYSEDGTLLARDWGHTEGVTDIALICSPDPSGLATKLVTVAADGTVFIWDTVPERPGSSGSDKDSSLQVPPLATTGGSSPALAEHGPPLRKVISHSELARFHRSKSIDLENEPLSPTAVQMSLRSPTALHRKGSRLSVRPTPRLEPSPLAGGRASNRESRDGGKSRQRSPSPPPPPASPLRTRQSALLLRGKPGVVGAAVLSPSTEKANPLAVAAAAAGKADGPPGVAAGGFGSVSAATEQTCRALRAYRQRLEKAGKGAAAAAATTTAAPDQRLRELERELEATMAAVRTALGSAGTARAVSSSSSAAATAIAAAAAPAPAPALAAPSAAIDEELGSATQKLGVTTPPNPAAPTPPSHAMPRKAPADPNPDPDPELEPEPEPESADGAETETEAGSRDASSQDASFVSATESRVSDGAVSESEGAAAAAAAATTAGAPQRCCS